MWFNHLILAGLGILSGVAVAGGAFALITALTVVPRLVGKSSTAKKILHYENIIVAGGVVGNVISVYPHIPIPLGKPLLIVFGLFSGIQVGCLVMALAEIMNVFPLVFRRLKMNFGLEIIIFSMAAGKFVGGLLYFFQRMGT